MRLHIEVLEESLIQRGPCVPGYVQESPALCSTVFYKP